jgi:7,8-dihydropterin-6-yl-methyl-4-(beta-D-ribofuranosyl)aminobenzene 5'-phosphate synthase
MAQDNRLLNLYDAFGEEAGQAIPDWGFSALIHYNGKIILFDGGSSADILQHNAKVLGVDLAKVDMAVLSHSHFDHTSGLDYLLKINPEVKLYLPNDPTIGGWPAKDAEEAAWNKKYQRGYRFRDANVTYVKERVQITPEIALIATTSSLVGLFSKYPPHDKDPLFSGLPEVSLAMQTRDGQWVLVVGCSHSQVENIVRETKKYLGKNVAGVAGGFHQLPYPSDYISDIAKMLKDELQVKWVAPAHCTGKTAHEVFKALYKENYRHFGLGSRVIF